MALSNPLAWAERLGGLLGSEWLTYQWVEATLLLVSAEEGEVTAAALSSKRSPVSGENSERVVWSLRDAGALLLERRGASYRHDGYRLTSPERLRWAIQTTYQVQHLRQRWEQSLPPVDRYRLVATIPEGIDAPRQGFSPLGTALQQLALQATERILLISPFLDPNGLAPLTDALVARAHAGVQVDLMVGEVGGPRSPNRRSVARLAQRVAREGLVDRFSLWRFEQREGARITFTFHAKALVADRSRAYLGSANMTVNGMERNLELGTILEGPSATQVADFLHALLLTDAASKLDLLALVDDVER